MRNSRTVVVLSAVAVTLVLGLGVCIAINPLTAIAITPILAAVTIMISVIGGVPTNPGHYSEQATLGQDAYTITHTDNIDGVDPVLLQDSLTDIAGSAAVLEQLARIQRAIAKDPALADSAKDLIESTATVVSSERWSLVVDEEHFPAVVEQAQQDFGLQKGTSRMKHGDFGQYIAGLALSISGTGLDIDRLTSLLPPNEPAGARRIAASDIEVIEQLTAAFRRQDFTHGSGLIRDTAVTQLRSALPLLSAQIGPEARPRLLLAIADLAAHAGWMSFEVNQHDAARRLWTVGLDIARNADHPQADDLAVYLLLDMALQAVHLQRPEEALQLVQIGHATAAGSRHPVCASTISLLRNVQARAHAAQGDGAACDRALGQGVEHISSIDRVVAPPWTSYVSEAGLTGHQGAAYYALALADQDQRAAERAVPLLSRAVNRYGLGYARLKGLYLPDLVGAHALAGDLDAAVTVGYKAMEAVRAVSSPRAYDRLRTLHTVLGRFSTHPGVAHLRDRLIATAA